MAYDTSTVIRRGATGHGSVATPAYDADSGQIVNVEFVRQYVQSLTGVTGDQLAQALVGSLRIAGFVSSAAGLPTGLGQADTGSVYVVSSTRQAYAWFGSYFVMFGSDLSGYVRAEAGRGLSERDFTAAHEAKLDALPSDMSGYVRAEAGKDLSSNDFTTALKTKLESLLSRDETATAESVTGLASRISVLESVYGSSSSSVTTVVGTLASLTSRVGSLEGDVAQLESGLGELADATSGLDATLRDVGGQVDAISGSYCPRDEVERHVAGLSNRLDAVESGMTSAPTSGVTKEYVDNKLSNFTITLDGRYASSASLDRKVDKVAGKGLSTNDLTAERLGRLDDALTRTDFLSNGVIRTSFLPSYVDDVIEFTSMPSTGETGKIYVDTTTNRTYRWSGSQFIQISSGASSAEVLAGRYYSMSRPGDFYRMVVDIARALGAEVDAEVGEDGRSVEDIAAGTGVDLEDDTLDELATALGVDPDDSMTIADLEAL